MIGISANTAEVDPADTVLVADTGVSVVIQFSDLMLTVIASDADAGLVQDTASSPFSLESTLMLETEVSRLKERDAAAPSRPSAPTGATFTTPDLAGSFLI
ncbi:hypothetical protein D3C81_1158660 [compost metagenome]